jgi:hypothetical protein
MTGAALWRYAAYFYLSRKSPPGLRRFVAALRSWCSAVPDPGSHRRMTDEQDPKAPPGAVSNQNGEEAETQHEDSEFGLRRLRPVNADEERPENEDGGAGEGSQSTGNPDSAG